MRFHVTLSVLLGVSGIVSAAAQPAVDVEPNVRQKPYSPADGQVVQVTPPPFMWVPAGPGAGYVLQVSRSARFEPPDTLTFENLKRCVHVPGKALAQGQWHWRYGVKTADGTVYSRVRSFVVPEGAREFAFPDFEQAARRVPVARPRLFFPGEQLARVREAAKNELKGEIDRLRAACERAIGEELVAEPGYQPREPEKRGPWAVEVMRTTRPPMDAMERCALAYLVTGERRFGMEAKRRLLHFFSWDPEGPTSFFAYDEPPMWVMMRGTRAYDWTHKLFTAEERTKVELNMRARARQFLKRLESMPFESSPYESHAGRLPGFLGECAISFIHEWPEARSWLEYATLLYCTSYPAWGGDDGGWQEGPSYWSAYMGFAVHYVVALKRATGVDLMKKPFFRNTPYYGLYAATPYFEHAPFGDNAHRPPPEGHVMYTFSTLTQNPYFRWHAEASGYRPGADVLSLATYDPRLEAKAPTELPQARVFPAVGLVAMHKALGQKEGDVSFLLRSSPFGSASHGHADQNAFVIEAFGKGLAIATGYYPWYGSPHHHDWTRATRAVNSILVDGQGQERRSFAAAGRIVEFQHRGDYDYAEAEAGVAYGGKLKRFRRHVVHVREPGLFVVYDDLEAVQASTFQWLLHAYDRMEVADGGRQFTIKRDGACMKVQMLLPQSVNVTQTDRYDPEPEDARGRWSNTWHLTASTVERATTARFLTVLAPYRAGTETVQPTARLMDAQGAVAVFIEGGGNPATSWKETIVFRTDGDAKTIRCGPFRSDGRVFAVRSERGGKFKPLVIGGREVRMETGAE